MVRLLFSLLVGVAQYFVCDSKPTVRFSPSGVVPLLATNYAGTDLPPFGTLGVSHWLACSRMFGPILPLL